MTRLSRLIAFILLASVPVRLPAAAADAQALQRLAGLCRLWGLVKFCHPYPATRGIDWDAALIETLPRVREAASSEAYGLALRSLVDRLDDPVTSVERAPASERTPPAAPPGSPALAGRAHPFVERTEDGIAIVTATDYRQFAPERTGWTLILDAFKKAFTEAAASKRVLVDLRNLGGSPSYLLDMALSDNLSRFLKEDVPLPPLRYLSYTGYPSQKEPTLYHAELALRSNGRLRAAAPSGKAPDLIVILVNEGSLIVPSHLAALQDAGIALLVLEGAAAPPAGVPAMDLDLPEGFRARVRTAEILRRTGGPDFDPDLVVPSDGRAAALAVLRGERRADRPHRAGEDARAVRSFSLADEAYPEMVYPDRDHRLLALFRFWNVIDRFFPYKDLMDRPWGEALLEFIPRMEAAKDALEYTLAVAEFATRIQDSHGMVLSPIYERYLGLRRPALQVTYAEGRSVVSLVRDPALGTKRVAPGDVVLSVDGEKAEDRRARLRKVLPASTVGRLEAKIDMTLLAGDPEKPARVDFRKPSGEIVHAVLPRTLEVPLRPEPSSLPNVTVLPEGFGYIDLGRLLDSEVDGALERVKDAPGLVLDMRGYPVGGSFRLFARLAKARTLFTRFDFPEFSGAAASFSLREEPGYVEPIPGPFVYAGRIAVLIHGSTQSAAEHTCLGLEAVAGVAFVGSPTSGANGNITYAVVPGNIVIRFTGMGVRHADGSRLQRLGIRPHVWAEPTVEGLRAGRDEVLEKAVEFLRSATAGD